ncbi:MULTISPECIES: hypothetical protein [Pseudomonas]|uniref:Uncharacterized protein n=2 Tax=Pseudomonas TaxID=286 RepID=A0A0D0TE16_PSEFL|nr:MULTISPECIES: hypothetical protein [Pseudomonas]AZE62920.1 hypothetical protein C4K02_4585 [Pseudomonas synxantha]KIR19080.1 hypothetical protein PFLU3_50600 [Pseudomonas fluorescens]MBV4481321.1 hypothetical protein [Pseudomonas khavaziana]
MGKVLGENDKISGLIASWAVPFETSFVAHLNGESGFNSTVGIMSGFALLKVSIDQDIQPGQTYEIGAPGSDTHKVRLEFDDTRPGEQGTYFATSGEFTVLQLQGQVLNASLHFKATKTGHRRQEMSFSNGAFKVEDFKHS